MLQVQSGYGTRKKIFLWLPMLPFLCYNAQVSCVHLSNISSVGFPRSLLSLSRVCQQHWHTQEQLLCFVCLKPDGTLLSAVLIFVVAPVQSCSISFVNLFMARVFIRYYLGKFVKFFHQRF